MLEEVSFSLAARLQPTPFSCCWCRCSFLPVAISTAVACFPGLVLQYLVVLFVRLIASVSSVRTYDARARHQVLHSSEASALASRAARGSICIVGMGNSACDLAVGEAELSLRFICVYVCVSKTKRGVCKWAYLDDAIYTSTCIFCFATETRPLSGFSDHEKVNQPNSQPLL